MREGNRDVGEVWEVRKKKKKTAGICPRSEETAQGMECPVEAESKKIRVVVS